MSLSKGRREVSVSFFFLFFLKEKKSVILNLMCLDLDTKERLVSGYSECEDPSVVLASSGIFPVLS